MSAIDVLIDPKQIDVELQFTGCKPGGMDDKSFGTAYPDNLLFPKREWKQRIEELREIDPTPNSVHPRGCIIADLGPYVFNQSPESSCVLNATAGAIMRCWNRQLGLDYQVILAPMSTYCRMTRSRNSGTYMWKALGETSLDGRGMLPSNRHGQADKFDHTFHENTPFVQRERLPNGWENTAKYFRVVEWLRIDSLEQYGSALLNQFPVVMGRSGHSMVAEDLVINSGTYYARICDSYGFSSRDGTGRVYDSERTMSKATGGAWAARLATYPSDPEKFRNKQPVVSL